MARMAGGNCIELENGTLLCYHTKIFFVTQIFYAFFSFCFHFISLLNALAAFTTSIKHFRFFIAVT